MLDQMIVTYMRSLPEVALFGGRGFYAISTQSPGIGEDAYF